MRQRLRSHLSFANVMGRMKLRPLVGMRRLALAALVASALVAVSSAGAAFPGHNGRVTFMRQDNADLWQIWVANSHLGSQVQLTHLSADSGWPVWSPGGAKLAFDSDRADPNPGDSKVINDIFTMNPNGSGVAKLTDSKRFNGDAGWSPDGSLIAFDSDRGHRRGKLRIYVMNADGTHPRRITTLPANLPAKAEGDASPRFSPNGKRLLFIRYRGEQNSHDPSALYTVGMNGRGLRRVTPWGISAGDADWSPNGKRLVFEANPNGSPYGEVYRVRANGEHLGNLTNNYGNGGGRDPVWSPNGRKILFGDARVVNGVFKNGLATMKPDGTRRRFISATPMTEHQPDWESIPISHMSASG